MSSEYYDDDETSDDDESSEDSAADDIIDSLTAGEDPIDESYMNEVDKRLEVTTYYRELLRGSLFTESTEATRIVENEVRRFVRDRVEILLGIKKIAAEPVAIPIPFSEQEVTALKVLAGRLIGNPSIVPEKKPAEPVLRQATSPMAPAPAIVRAGPTPVAKPVPLKKKEAVSTPASTPAPRPVATPAAAKRPVATPAPKGKKSKKPAEESPRQIKKTVIHPEHGHEVEITLDRIQRPSNAIPFPTGLHFETVIQQQSMDAAAKNHANQTNPRTTIEASAEI